jgi:hypothetical protein
MEALIMTASRARRSTAAVRGLGWSAAATLVALALLGPAAVLGTDGNNGTVKIHEGATETEPGPQNEPHVCEFHLHFFFADPEQSGTWEIQEWSPGDKGEVVLDGDYDTAGDGEDRDPADGVHTLPDGHYKLFWDGDLDTDKHDKHKVFWVDCEETTTSTTTETTTTEAATTSTSTAPGGNVSETITLPPTSTEDPAASGNSQLISFGLLLLAVGSLVLGLARPMAPRRVRDR